MPTPSDVKTSIADGGRHRQRVGERGPHERRGAGRRDEGRHRAVGEGARAARADPARDAVGGAGDARPHLEDAEQVEREQQEQEGERPDDDRLLHVEPPPDELAPGAQEQQHAGERPERDDHPAGEEQAVPKRPRAVFPRLRHEPEDLDREHRQHARHDVQHEAAEEREEQRQGERLDAVAGLGRRRCGRRRGRARGGAAAGRRFERVDAPRAVGPAPRAVPARGRRAPSDRGTR